MPSQQYKANKKTTYKKLNPMKTRNRLPKFALILIACILMACSKENHPSPDIVVLVKYKAQPSKEADAVAELTRLIEKVKQEPHFLTIRLHIDANDKTNILLYEEWSDESYYNSEHMKTAHLQKFIEDSRNFLSGPPEISFWRMEKEFKP